MLFNANQDSPKSLKCECCNKNLTEAIEVCSYLKCFALLPFLYHSLRAWKAANGTQLYLQTEGETVEEQTRLRICLAVVHMCVSGTLNGLRVSGLVHFPFQQNVMNN